MSTDDRMAWLLLGVPIGIVIGLAAWGLILLALELV